jgi:hypothetical protein
MAGVDEGSVVQASRSLLQGALSAYWFVLAAVVLYAVLAITSFRAKTLGTARKTCLASGVASIVYVWAFCTVVRIHTAAFGGHALFVHPHDFIRIGLESSACLFVILLPLTHRNLISRRIRMPTAFTLGIGASIAAVYGDLLFVLWASTPVR